MFEQTRWSTILLATCLMLVVQSTAAGGEAVKAPAKLTAGFRSSKTVAKTNLVRLSGTTEGDIVTVSVSIDGPTASADLHSFAFDLVLGDPKVVRYKSGSATFGNALRVVKGQSPQVMAVQIGDRVTVGVTKLGGGPGNAITGSDTEIMTLQFQLKSKGSSTLAIDGSSPYEPAAIDSKGAEIAGVDFDTEPALLSASQASIAANGQANRTN